jgi:hypothetical protein
MKKSFLTISFLAIIGISFGQIIQQPQTPASLGPASEDRGTDMKPEAGNITFEVNFTPFSGTPIQLSYLRFRYFLSENVAVRAGVSLGLRSGGDNSSFEYGLLPGIEKHFKGTKRLSPFIGGELILAGRSSSGSITAGTNTRRINGAWLDGSNRSFFNFGLNGIIGCDYYISQHFYMGIEGGYGFSLISNGDIVTTDISGTQTQTTTITGGSAFTLGPNFNSAIRLGFAF